MKNLLPHELNPYEAKELYESLKAGNDSLEKRGYIFKAKILGNEILYVEPHFNGEPIDTSYGFIIKEIDKNIKRYEKAQNALTETINVRVSKALLERINTYCQKSGENPSELVRNLIKKWDVEQ